MNKMHERILELRDQSGLRSSQVANLCGWTVGRYSHYETGKRAISLEHALTLCKALEPIIGDRFLYLATGKNPTNDASQVADGLGKGFIHRDEAMRLFKEVLEFALRDGSLSARDSVIDDLVKHYSLELAGICYTDQSEKVKS